MPTYVALDLETTGLNPEDDEIIEVGAVRGGDGRRETFHTFISPRRPVPRYVQRLTGIAPADLAGAPTFPEIAGALEQFIGDSPVVGQNVSFDLGFLRRRDLCPPGPAYDTRDLACMLLPGLPDYSLGTIATALGVDFPVRHRALADAQATGTAFDRLLAELRHRPPAILEEAERLATTGRWEMALLFREAREGCDAGGDLGDTVHQFLRRPVEAGPPVSPAPRTRPVDESETRRLLTRVCADVMPGFELRREQERMAERVTAAFNQGDHLVIEAGTGVGKSLAYLLPAALHALLNGQKVLVSTNTINLQEQLMGQEIPLLRQLLAEGGLGNQLRATVLKGRRNYLCLVRWLALRNSPSLTVEEARLLVRLLFWLPATETGDRAELNLSQWEDYGWSRLSAQDESCNTSACPFARDGTCFLVRARRRAEASHLVVVNHALLLSDVATEGAVLPEYGHLVIDEAHHLEEEATDQFGFAAGQGDVLDYLDGVAGKGRERSGSLLGRLREWTRGFAGRLDLPGAGQAAESLAAAASRARERLPEFWSLLPPFIQNHAPADSDYGRTLLLDRTARVQPAWSEVEAAWEQAELTLADVLEALRETADVLGEIPFEDAAAEMLRADAVDLLAAGRRLQAGLSAAIMGENGMIAWLSQDRTSGLPAVSSAPLDVGGILRDGVFARKDSVVLTGATLASGGDFHYLRGRLGLEDGQEVLLGSPFDYRRSTLVLVPRDMPEPNQATYGPALWGALTDLIRASRGRALVLFTSHAALRAAYEAIRAPLEEDNITVLAHGLDGTPRQLTNALRQSERAAILGAASFWEGVDVVGEALSLLVMTRLPFTVPTDPIFRARSEQFERPFEEYAVPQAVIRFRQGFGRLIRRKTDRGVMVVLDRRVRSRQYGQSFLDALPDCPVQEMLLREMPAAVTRWLGTG